MFLTLLASGIQIRTTLFALCVAVDETKGEMTFFELGRPTCPTATLVLDVHSGRTLFLDSPQPMASGTLQAVVAEAQKSLPEAKDMFKTFLESLVTERIA